VTITGSSGKGKSSIAQVLLSCIPDEYKNYCNYDGRKFKAKISFTKEMKSYGNRYGKFSFFERSYGCISSKFEGIRINENWSKGAAVDKDYRTF
jgi:energy-coupling factor transporter ATP-binding protein EcfA2